MSKRVPANRGVVRGRGKATREELVERLQSGEFGVKTSAPINFERDVRHAAETLVEVEERNRELTDAGDRLAREVELRWSGPGGCDCPVCTAAQAWRDLRSEDDE